MATKKHKFDLTIKGNAGVDLRFADGKWAAYEGDKLLARRKNIASLIAHVNGETPKPLAGEGE